MVDLLQVSRRRDLPLAFLIAAGTLAFFWAPRSNGDVTCLLRLHAGQACPGCGMTRAAGSLSHGDIAASFAYNPYVMVFVGQALAFGLWRFKSHRRPMTAKQQHLLVWALLANCVLVLAVWIVRHATGHIAGVY